MSKKAKNDTVIYSKAQYEADEKRFTDGLNEGTLAISEFQRLMTQDIILNSSVLDNGCIGVFRPHDIEHILRNPKDWRRQLDLSECLMRISPHFYRLNMAFGNMAVFDWGIDLYGVKTPVYDNLKKSYANLANKLEQMQLKHEFQKIMRRLPYMDVFCGLLMEDGNDAFFQSINPRICRIYRLQDGLYNYAIDFNLAKPGQVATFPPEVQQAYKDFKSGKRGDKWYIPPADLQICIKLNHQWRDPYPLLLGLVRDILDLDKYKHLKLQAARTDNYKAIVVNVPIDDERVDKPLLTDKLLVPFAQMNHENMPSDVGLLHVLGGGAQAVNFKDSANTRNNVSDAVDSLYDDSGLTRELFNGSSSGTAVKLSIENDAAFLYDIYRQLERWINRFIKLRGYNKSTYKFSFYLLDTTIFNRNEVADRYKNAASLGATVIDKWMAAMDMTPARILGSYILHDEIYGFHNHFVPLASSYNSSSDSTGGRPTNESQGLELSEAGEATQDSDANMDR